LRDNAVHDVAQSADNVDDVGIAWGIIPLPGWSPQARGLARHPEKTRKLLAGSDIVFAGRNPHAGGGEALGRRVRGAKDRT